MGNSTKISKENDEPHHRNLELSAPLLSHGMGKQPNFTSALDRQFSEFAWLSHSIEKAQTLEDPETRAGMQLS